MKSIPISIVTTAWRVESHGYPFVQSLGSLSSIADEFVVGLFEDDDTTRDGIESAIRASGGSQDIEFFVHDPASPSWFDLATPGWTQRHLVTHGRLRARHPVQIVVSLDEVWSDEAVRELAHLLGTLGDGSLGGGAWSIGVPTVNLRNSPMAESAFPTDREATVVFGNPPGSAPTDSHPRIAVLANPLFRFRYMGPARRIARRIFDEASSYYLNSKTHREAEVTALHVVLGRLQSVALDDVASSVIHYDGRWPIPASVGAWWQEVCTENAAHDEQVQATTGIDGEVFADYLLSGKYRVPEILHNAVHIQQCVDAMVTLRQLLADESASISKLGAVART